MSYFCTNPDPKFLGVNWLDRTEPVLCTERTRHWVVSRGRDGHRLQYLFPKHFSVHNNNKQRKLKKKKKILCVMYKVKRTPPPYKKIFVLNKDFHGYELL